MSERTERLGDVLLLMSQSEVHKAWTLDDFARLVVPPLVLGQEFFFTHAGQPAGWFSWANLTQEAESGFLDRTRKLQPEDWNAGDGSRIWIIDGLAPYGGLIHMAKHIRTELRKRAQAEDWPATQARWARCYGSGEVQKMGKAA